MKPKNNKDLFNFICDQMEKLDDGSITVEQGQAQATLAKQANNSLRYEIDRAKTQMKLDEYNRENDTEIRLRQAEENF